MSIMEMPLGSVALEQVKNRDALVEGGSLLSK